jgi:hypothetical protein
MRPRPSTVLKAAALLAIAVLAGRWIWRALASDETKIRWVCEDMLDGFNQMRTARVVRGLAPAFLDESSGVTREEVREVCIYVFMNELDPDDKGFALRAEFVPEEWTVKVAEGTPKRATATLGARFFDKRGEKERLFWQARVEGELARGDDGWQWTRMTSVNHSDRRLH